jgi:hypothetical protein
MPSGKTITDIHADNTTRFKNEGDAGNTLATTTANASTEAGRTRADVQKSQGAWGPFGLAGFIIAMMFAYHVSMIVLDSTPWHIGLTTVWYVIPWLQWIPHPSDRGASRHAARQVRGNRTRDLAGAVLCRAALGSSRDCSEGISAMRSKSIMMDA